MDMTTLVRDDKMIIYLSGEIDHHSAREIREGVDRLIITHRPKAFILDLAGIKNVRAKCLRSNNPANVVKATIEGLKSLRSAEDVAKARDIEVAQVKA